MDSYSEHLVQIRKNGSALRVLIFLWTSMLAISLLSFFLLNNFLFPVIITIVAVVGSVKLTQMLSIEYEYIVTNGEVDIDIITSKSRRKRILSFHCKDIDRIEAYTKDCDMFKNGNYDKKSMYCNPDDRGTYCVSFKHRSIGSVCLVLQIPKKMQEAMHPYLDKLVAREAFDK